MPPTKMLRSMASRQAKLSGKRERIKFELGITVSVGVSYNKTFAKLRSDMAPPDSIEAITQENYKDIVWPLPVSRLLYVGPATTKELHRSGVFTIGDLAKSSADWLTYRFGKRGLDLWRTANGIDYDPVANKDFKARPKTVGNSTTTVRDMVSLEDIKVTVMMLSEMVAERMRAISYVCRTIQVTLRDTDLSYFQRQSALPFPTTTAKTIYTSAMELILKHWRPSVRCVRKSFSQLSFCPEIKADQQAETLESVVQSLRNRFGKGIVQKGCMMVYPELSGLGSEDNNNLNTVAFKK